MTAKIRDITSGTVHTSGATTATVATWTVPSGHSVRAKAIVVAREANGDSLSGERQATFLDLSGTLSLAGSVDTTLPLVGTAGLLTAALTLDASANTIRVRATGVAVKEIDWWAWLETYAYQP